MVVIFPYSLGDAIDWKRQRYVEERRQARIPYSLGDAIDWKHTVIPPNHSTNP